MCLVANVRNYNFCLFIRSCVTDIYGLVKSRLLFQVQNVSRYVTKWWVFTFDYYISRWFTFYVYTTIFYPADTLLPSKDVPGRISIHIHKTFIVYYTGTQFLMSVNSRDDSFYTPVKYFTWGPTSTEFILV